MNVYRTIFITGSLMVLASLCLVLEISRDPSSTAAIGYILIPVILIIYFLPIGVVVGLTLGVYQRITKLAVAAAILAGLLAVILNFETLGLPFKFWSPDKFDRMTFRPSLFLFDLGVAYIFVTLSFALFATPLGTKNNL